MGLGRLFMRNTNVTVSDTVSGASATFTIVDNIAPNWASSNAYRGAMSIPGAWRGALILSDLLGQVPWHAYRKMPNRAEELIEPNPPLLEQPNPPRTRMTTFSSWGLDLVWHGNAVGIIAARTATGWPTAIVPVSAAQVGVRQITPYDQSPLPVGALEYSVGAMRFAANELIHIMGPCEPGALRGMGVLESHFDTLNLAQAQSRQAASISSHGVPTGVLTTDNPDTTPTQMKAAKAAWLEAQATRTVAALGPGTKFTALSWNPEELQMVEGRKFTLTEMELIFGLPPGWLGGQTATRTYSNIEQDAVNLLKFSLGGHLARFEQTLSLAFPRFTNVRASLDAVLRADTLTRYQAHRIALGGNVPFLDVDEVREMEHRAPMPDKTPIPDAFVDEGVGADAFVS